MPIVVYSMKKQKEMVDFYDKKNEQIKILQNKLQMEEASLESQLGKMFGSDKVFLRKDFK